MLFVPLEPSDLLCFDISITPGCKVCATCSFELSKILNGNTQNKDIISLLTSDLNTLSSENEINNELLCCEMTLKKVCYLLIFILMIWYAIL